MTALYERTRIVLVTLLIVAAAALGACNTIEGIGEDISESARRVKKAL